MKTAFRKSAFVLLILLAWARFPGNAAAAESAPFADGIPPYIDCTDDQRSYGETAALLNQAAERLGGYGTDTTDGKKADNTGLWPVLCRTNGEAFSFEKWEPICVLAGPYDCYTLYFGSEAIAARAAAALSALPEIRYAEPDSAVEACSAGAVTFHSWGAESMNYAPYLDYSGELAEGSVTVAVVDSGVYPHPFFQERLTESGYDYVDADDDATDDPFGHGTNVTGIIADCTQGFPVCFYPVRVLNATGNGSVSNTVNGIREAMEKQVDVINLSLATRKVSAALDAAVLDALDAGITVVAAAGNAASDTAQVSPANLTDTGVIIVGAAEEDGSLASYTNYGSSVDLYTYGTMILCCSNSGGYTEATGTSIAAPHVTGLASLLLLTHSGIAPEEIETRICLSTDKSEEVNIPDLVRMIPARPGLSLTLLKMDLQDSVSLPADARPVTAMESVRYESSDSAVISVQGGTLIPVGAGLAEITAQCPGMPEVRFTVAVTEEDCTAITLPQGLRAIGSEAFSGDGAVLHILVPEGCETIAAGAFDGCASLKTVELPATVTALEGGSFSDAVVLCPEDELLEALLLAQNVPYIAKS